VIEGRELGHIFLIVSVPFSPEKPIPTCVLPLKGRELESSPPFKGEIERGMG
jgi:hypothetical protein